MGLDVDSVRFFLSAQHLGFEGKNICTLGRQGMFVSKRGFDAVMREYDKHLPYPDKDVCYAEDYFGPLGFKIEALDASDYEGADIVHDLNLPIPDELRERYDLVWDGGTLEHVFNFPTALQNVMQMTKVGGHVILEPPANNFCGHGFYQFSPELFFRVFSPKNGFELLRIYALREGKAYHIADPMSIHGRVQLLDSEAVSLRVHARKIANLPLSIVQQSDYAETWDKPKQPSQSGDGPLKAFLRKNLSDSQLKTAGRLLYRMRIRRAIRRWRADSKLSNRSIYRPVTNWREPTIF